MKKKKNVAPIATSENSSGWIWVGVAVILIFFAGIRLRLLDIPLERDEGEYAYAGQLILEGLPPYQMAHNMKLPGTYAAYALIMAIFGESVRGIHLGLLIVNAASSVLVFLLARRLFDAKTALVVCASYGLLSASSSVLGLAAHANHFVMLFALAAWLVLLRTKESGRWRDFLLSGFLFGLSFLMKQQGIFFGLFGGLCLLISEIRTKPIVWQQSLRRLSLFVAGMIAPFAAVCVSLWTVGLWEKFWFWTFSYARAYGSVVSFSMLPLALKSTLPDVVIHNEILWVFAGVGLLMLLWEKTSRPRAAWMIGFLIFSILAVSPGFYFRRNYFIQLLPALALLIGAAVHAGRALLGQTRFPRAISFLPVIIFMGGFAFTVFGQRQIFFQVRPADACLMNYSENPFIESAEIARYIRERTTADTKIAVVGSEPQIYFYAKRKSATGYIYMYPLMEDQPYARQMQQEMIQEIEKAAPPYLVFVAHPFSWLVHPESDQSVLQWLNSYRASHYETVGVVDFISLEDRRFRWDAEAASGPQTEDYVEILKRKTN